MRLRDTLPRKFHSPPRAVGHFVNLSHLEFTLRCVKLKAKHISDGNPCYDRDTHAAQRCVPDFINAAFNLQVEVTNTCGVRAPTR